MFCPKCKDIYNENMKVCPECNSLLIEENEYKKTQKINEAGLNYIKNSLYALFFVFTKLIIVVLIYEFYFVYRMKYVGVVGTVLSNINPLIWGIFIIEISICFVIFLIGLNQKNKV